METFMAPLTWDRHTPIPNPNSQSVELDTNPTQTFESDFGEGHSERTVITKAAYDLKPRFTGRIGAFAQLQALTGSAFKESKAGEPAKLGFAVVIGEPGMGKS